MSDSHRARGLRMESCATDAWVEVGRIEDVPRQGARVVEGPAGPIALFRTHEDELFAVEDRCPHRGGPLSQGIVHGCRVTCPLHGWQVHLDSGRAVAPDEGQVRTHRVEVLEGRVRICLSVDPSPTSEP